MTVINFRAHKPKTAGMRRRHLPPPISADDHPYLRHHTGPREGRDPSSPDHGSDLVIDGPGFLRVIYRTEQKPEWSLWEPLPEFPELSRRQLLVTVLFALGIISPLLIGGFLSRQLIPADMLAQCLAWVLNFFLWELLDAAARRGPPVKPTEILLEVGFRGLGRVKWTILWLGSVIALRFLVVEAVPLAEAGFVLCLVYTAVYSACSLLVFFPRYRHFF